MAKIPPLDCESLIHKDLSPDPERGSEEWNKGTAFRSRLTGKPLQTNEGWERERAEILATPLPDSHPKNGKTKSQKGGAKHGNKKNQPRSKRRS